MLFRSLPSELHPLLKLNVEFTPKLLDSVQLLNDEMVDYLISKYGSIENAQTGSRYYYTIEGDRVDATTYGLLPVARRGVMLSSYEQEIQDNDQKRRIKVVPPALIHQVAADFRTLFR